MKFALVVVGLLVSVGAFAKSVRCVVEGTGTPVAVLMNVEGLERVGEFPVRFQIPGKKEVLNSTCGIPNHAPEVYCMFHLPAPGPSYFLKFDAFTPAAAANRGQVFVYSYGKNNTAIANIVCQ